jgi:hypothetical protein
MFPDAAVVRAMAARLEGDLERALNVLLELGAAGAFDNSWFNTVKLS